MQMSVTELEKCLGSRDEFLRDIKKRLESAVEDGGKEVGYFHTAGCAGDPEYCWHACNPDGFKEAVEVADLLDRLSVER